MHRAAVLAAFALAACTAGDPDTEPSPSGSPTPTEPPDEQLLLAAYRRNERLADLYAGSLGNRPVAAPLRSHAAEHEAALLARLATPPTPTPSPTSVARPVAVTAVAALARRTARDDTAAAARAADPANALLLAELGACRAQHAVLLGRVR